MDARGEALIPRQQQTFCRICNAACGAVVTIDGTRVTEVRGDRDHPVSRGYLCPKGRAIPGQHHHPDRLDHPLLGRGDDRRRAPWTETLDDLADRIRGIVDEAGPRALGMYKGTAHYLESAAYGLAPTILTKLGSDSWYTSLTVDCPAVTLVAELVVGHPWLLPVPDVHATLTVLVGTNPVVSHGHTFNVPRPKEWLRDSARQGELWVIDPRRTESADVATAHLAPRPGTDYVLLAHLVRELLDDGADHAYLDRHADGVAALTEAVRPFTRERAARATGLSPIAIGALLQRIRHHERVAVATGTGLNFQPAANLSVWMAWMISAVTGSLDRERGLWFNPGYLGQTDTKVWEPRDGTPAPGPASRPDLSGHFGELPCAGIVDEIEAGNLRALVVLGGNPLIAWPDPDRVTRALRSLEVLAVVDVIEHELVDLATHVLPATGQLERADVPTGPEVYALSSFSQYTDRVVAPHAERRATWWMLAQLARRLGLDVPAGIDPDRADEETVLRALFGGDAERWAALREAPTAIVDARHPYGWVHSKLPDERIRLAPKVLLDQLARARDPEPEQLSLIPGRQLRKTNSTLADGRGMRTPAAPQSTLHPDDAARLGIVDGAPIVLTTANGELSTVARVDDRVAVGSVSAPHGFVQANAARLTGSRPGAVDATTGMPFTTGLPVTVRCA